MQKASAFGVQDDPVCAQLRRDLEGQVLSEGAAHCLVAFERDRNRSGTERDWLQSALETYRRISAVFHLRQRIEEQRENSGEDAAEDLVAAVIALYVGIVSGRTWKEPLPKASRERAGSSARNPRSRVRLRVSRPLWVASGNPEPATGQTPPPAR